MRIVFFSNPDRIVVYPFEGVSAFRTTRKIGNDIVGEYYGIATEAELPNYTGTWPIPVVVSYETVMDAATFKNELTDNEWNAILTSANVVLVKVSRLFTTRNGKVNTESAKFNTFVSACVTEAIMNQARADELKLGKVIE